MDDDAYAALSRFDLPQIKLIPLISFEKDDLALKKAKENRSRIEYYFTCTPSLPWYVINNCHYVDLITYLDADLFFYDDPNWVFQEIGNKSIGIIDHRYSKSYKSMQNRGKYNVGWVSFRRDVDGMKCLSWWRERCIEWCYKRLENGRFADQKYLDDWPERFKNVKVIEQKGSNLGSWNLDNYNVSEKDGTVFIDEDRLIFFHFHRFRRLIGSIYSPGYMKVKANQTIRKYIYSVYLNAYLSAQKSIEELQEQDIFSLRRTEGRGLRFMSRLNDFARNNLSAAYRLYLSGNYVRAHSLEIGAQSAGISIPIR